MAPHPLDEIARRPTLLSVFTDPDCVHEWSAWELGGADGERRRVLAGPVADGPPPPDAPRAGAVAVREAGAIAFATGTPEAPALAVWEPGGARETRPTPAPVLGVAWQRGQPIIRVERPPASETPTPGSAAPRVRSWTTLPVRDWDHWRTEACPALLGWGDGGWTERWRGALGVRLVAHAAHPHGRALVLQLRGRGPDGQDHDTLLVGEQDDWTTLQAEPRATIDGLTAGPWGLAWTTHRRPEQGFGAPVATRAPWGGPTQTLGDPDGPWQSLLGFADDTGGLLCSVAREGERVLQRIGDGAPVALATGITQACAHRRGWVGVQGGIGRPPRRVCGDAPVDDRPRRHALVRRGSRATDGTRTSSFLVHGGRGAARPTLLWVHGGPLSLWADTWHPRWCPGVFVEAGYTVLMPNPRGSLGRGRAFRDAVGGDRWGEGPIDDLLAALDEASAHPAVDAARVAIMGASFGGWASAWLAATTDRFRCAVAHAAPTHFAALHGDTDVPGFLERHLGVGEPPAVSERWSPVHRAQGWRTPTLITHGARDMRVPVGQAIALYQALRRAGAPTALRVYEDAHHWLTRPADVEDWHASVLAFLGRHLGADQA